MTVVFSDGIGVIEVNNVTFLQKDEYNNKWYFDYKDGSTETEHDIKIISISEK